MTQKARAFFRTRSKTWNEQKAKKKLSLLSQYKLKGVDQNLIISGAIKFNASSLSVLVVLLRKYDDYNFKYSKTI